MMAKWVSLSAWVYSECSGFLLTVQKHAVDVNRRYKIVRAWEFLLYGDRANH